MAAEDIRQLHGVVQSITVRVDGHDGRIQDHEVRIVAVEDITDQIAAIFHFTQQASRIAVWTWRVVRAAVPILTGLFAIYSRIQGWW